jgi:hypothetical protein
MRNINDVIKQIEDVLPEDDELRKDLKRIKMSVLYTAPEAIVIRWRELQYFLEFRFAEDGKSELAQKVQRIFNNIQ